MTIYEKLNKLESENKKLENLLIAFRKVTNLDDAEELQTDLFTCFNHGENENASELNEIGFLLSELLGSRIDKFNELRKEIKRFKK